MIGYIRIQSMVFHYTEWSTYNFFFWDSEKVCWFLSWVQIIPGNVKGLSIWCYSLKNCPAGLMSWEQIWFQIKCCVQICCFIKFTVSGNQMFTYITRRRITHNMCKKNTSICCKEGCSDARALGGCVLAHRKCTGWWMGWSKSLIPNNSNLNSHCAHQHEVEQMDSPPSTLLTAGSVAREYMNIRLSPYKGAD